LKSKQWEEIELLNIPRLNSSSAALDGNFVYTFGGLGEYDHLSSIERYNIKLNIWSELKVKMPMKLSNSYACSVNKHEIVILGGMRPANSSASQKRFVVENTVY
jgi:N-acetylneuraminic acid mutarotase